MGRTPQQPEPEPEPQQPSLFEVVGALTELAEDTLQRLEALKLDIRTVCMRSP